MKTKNRIGTTHESRPVHQPDWSVWPEKVTWWSSKSFNKDVSSIPGSRSVEISGDCPFLTSSGLSVPTSIVWSIRASFTCPARTSARNSLYGTCFGDGVENDCRIEYQITAA